MLRLFAMTLTVLTLCGCAKWVNDLDLKVSLDGSGGPLKISRVYWAPYAFGTLAQEKGLFKKAGLDVQISVFPDVGDSRRAFERGGVDASMLTPFTFLMTKEIGIDGVVTMVLDFSAGGDGLVAHREVRSLKQLKGKKIGVEVGTIAHFTLIKALESVGLTEDDVKIYNILTDDLFTSFKERKVDAVSSWDPYLNRMVTEASGHLLYSTKSAPDIISDILVVNRKSYEKRRADWQKFHAVWLEAIDEYKRDPIGSIELMSRFERISPSALAQNISGIKLLSRAEQIRFLGDGVSSPTGLQHINDYQLFMKRNGLLNRTYDLRSHLVADMIRDHAP